MKKQPEITDATRETFLTAFYRLAEKKPIYKITVKELTTLAGYNRSTFYRYFVDVLALVEYIEDQFIDDMMQTITNQVENKHEPNDKLFLILLDKFEEHRERLTILLCEENRAHFIRRVQERILAEASTLMPDTSRNHVVESIYFNGIFSALATQITSAEPLSRDELLEILRHLFEKWFWDEIHHTL